MSTNRKKASERFEFWAYFLEFSSFPFPPPAAIQSSEIPKFSSASSSATLISWNQMQICVKKVRLVHLPSKVCDVGTNAFLLKERPLIAIEPAFSV